jgi:hypothetical protein
MLTIEIPQYVLQLFHLVSGLGFDSIDMQPGAVQPQSHKILVKAGF